MIWYRTFYKTFISLLWIKYNKITVHAIDRTIPFQNVELKRKKNLFIPEMLSYWNNLCLIIKNYQLPVNKFKKQYSIYLKMFYYFHIIRRKLRHNCIDYSGLRSISIWEGWISTFWLLLGVVLHPLSNRCKLNPPRVVNLHYGCFRILQTG